MKIVTCISLARCLLLIEIFFFFLGGGGGGGGGKFDTIEMQTEQERANFREEKLRPATDSKMLFY